MFLQKQSGARPPDRITGINKANKNYRESFPAAAFTITLTLPDGTMVRRYAKGPSYRFLVREEMVAFFIPAFSSLNLNSYFRKTTR